MADKSESGGGSDDPVFPCEDPTQPELEDWLKCMRDKLKKTEYLYLSRSETPPSFIGISAKHQSGHEHDRGWYGPPKFVSRARRWSLTQEPLPLRWGPQKPTARWPPAPPSTASEAPLSGQPRPRGASAATTAKKNPKGPKRTVRTRTAQIQMGRTRTTASTPAPGGSTRRQAISMALQGQQTHPSLPPGHPTLNLQTRSASPQPLYLAGACKRGPPRCSSLVSISRSTVVLGAAARGRRL